MFIERNGQGKIQGAFRSIQPGIAEEQIADDAPELLAYLNPQSTPMGVIQELERTNPHSHRSLRESPLFIDAVLRQLHAKINALDAEIAVLAGRNAAPLQNIPITHMVAAIKAVDDLIKIERAKL